MRFCSPPRAQVYIYILNIWLIYGEDAPSLLALGSFSDHPSNSGSAPQVDRITEAQVDRRHWRCDTGETTSPHVAVEVPGIQRCYLSPALRRQRHRYIIYITWVKKDVGHSGCKWWYPDDDLFSELIK